MNTPAVMSEIMDLINKINLYLQQDPATINVQLLERTCRWITRLLDVFGFTMHSSGLGWRAESLDQDNVDREQILLPYLKALSEFRDTVRQAAREKRPYVELLELCDKLRDEEMVELGVSLDDRSDGKALVKLVDRETLISARNEKKQVGKE